MKGARHHWRWHVGSQVIGPGIKYAEVRWGTTEPGSSWKSVTSSDSRLGDKGKRNMNPSLRSRYPRREKTEIANRPSDNREQIRPHQTEETSVD